MSYLLAPSMPAQAQPGDRSELLFGVGPVADSALVSELVQQAPVNMLTTWFNGTSDLSWHRLWRSSLIPASYDAGYARNT